MGSNLLDFNEFCLRFLGLPVITVSRLVCPRYGRKELPYIGHDITIINMNKSWDEWKITLEDAKKLTTRIDNLSYETKLEIEKSKKQIQTKNRRKNSTPKRIIPIYKRKNYIYCLVRKIWQI